MLVGWRSLEELAKGGLTAETLRLKLGGCRIPAPIVAWPCNVVYSL